MVPISAATGITWYTLPGTSSSTYRNACCMPKSFLPTDGRMLVRSMKATSARNAASTKATAWKILIAK